MKRLLLFLILVFTAYSALGAAEPPARVSPDQFAIVAWRVTGDSDALRGVYECGCNLAGPVAPSDLDAVEAAGLKAIVPFVPSLDTRGEAGQAEASVMASVRTFAEQMDDRPAAFGYFVRDEPNAKAFPVLSQYVAAFQKVAPEVQPFINLFPNYASHEQLGTDSYEEYLQKYVTTVKPPVVSYDHYALMDDGSLRKGYFANLEAVRAVSRSHDLPFWNVVLSTAHFNYAVPTPAGLRFQAYTTLAYGGRGICYFTYLTPATGNYRQGPIDQFGHKTPTWEMLRNVNLQIHALAPTMVKLKSVGVFHHPEVPDGCHGIADSKYLADVTGSGQFVVGEFEGADGTPYVMVVNKDLHQSTHFGVRFKQEGKILQVNSYTGHSDVWAGENNWLAAGQGMLLSLQR